MTEISPRVQKVFGDQPVPSILYAGSEGIQNTYRYNIENQLGTVAVPVGIAGPLRMTFAEYGESEYRVPLATTESCLVASVQRGMKLIREASHDGAHAQVYRVGVSRSPVLAFNGDPWTQAQLDRWIINHMDQMQDICSTVSKRLQLMRCVGRIEGRYVFLLFHFDTAEAMGMNMVSIGTQALIDRLITQQMDAYPIALSSNWCSDKKPSRMHANEGRGRRVTCKASFGPEALQEALHTTPQALQELAVTKLKLGSELAGSYASNAHHANVVAAFMLATGQDLGHIVEGSAGNTQITERNGVVTFEVELPSVMLGIVGGGTSLPLQQQYRHLIGLHPGDGTGMMSDELAAVLGGAVLAGEISLLGALAAQEHAQAHAAFRKPKQ